MASNNLGLDGGGPRRGKDPTEDRELLSHRLRAELKEAAREEWGGNDSSARAMMLRLLLIVPFVVLEITAVSVFWSGQSIAGLGLSVSVLLPHGVACLILPWALYPWLPRSYRDAPVLSSALIIGFSLPLPLLGPLCVVLILKLLNRVSTYAAKRQNPFWVVGSRVPDAGTVDFDGKLDASKSILQIMNGADPLARRNLILATKRLPPAQAVPVLRTGLRDSDEEVKLYAQGILSQLVERYEGSIAELKKSSETHPEDTELMLRLAEQYHEVVELDLVTDPELQAFYISNAIELLEQVLAVEPANEPIMLLLAKYCLQMNDPERALRVVDELQKLAVSPDLLEPLEIEALFQQRSWGAFRKRLNDGMVNRFCNPELQHLGRFWLGDFPSKAPGSETS